MNITEIISAVLTLIAVLVSAFVIPFLKTKLSEAQRKRIIEYVTVAVMAAEKLFPSIDGEKMGKEKLEYVANFLETKGIYFDVDDVSDEIRVMIESAVVEFCS